MTVGAMVACLDHQITREDGDFEGVRTLGSLPIEARDGV